MKAVCCCAVQIDRSARRQLIKVNRLEFHLRTGGLVCQRWSVQIAHDGQSDSRSNTSRLTHRNSDNPDHRPGPRKRSGVVGLFCLDVDYPISAIRLPDWCRAHAKVREL